MLIRIVLAFESSDDRKRMKAILHGFPDLVIETARSRKPRWDRLAGTVGDLMIVGRSLIPEPSSQHLALLREVPDTPEVVTVSPKEDVEDRAQLLAAGCHAVLNFSLSDKLLRDTLSTIISRLREEAIAKLRPPQDLGEPRLSDFVSDSPAMQTFMEIVGRIVKSDTTLLILGETGVGKERLAQAIHAESHRSKAPFLAINCGAIPEALLESELFGHVQGAFTGATRTRRGWFELAHNGTIFLDEIGEMPLHLQVKLLRVLQTRQVIPVGAETSISVNVRVMAASNRNLREEVHHKKFRQDLYYRLSVVTLEIPPLRERKEDVPNLVEKYIRYFQSCLPTSVQSISKDALEALIGYSWPGNVREFVNVLERAMLLCSGEKITMREIPGILGTVPAKGLVSISSLGHVQESIPREWIQRTLRDVRREAVEKVEKEYLEALLAETKGRIDETAKRSGMNSRNLFEKMRKYGLQKEVFKKKRTS